MHNVMHIPTCTWHDVSLALKSRWIHWQQFVTQLAPVPNHINLIIISNCNGNTQYLMVLSLLLTNGKIFAFIATAPLPIRLEIFQRNSCFLDVTVLRKSKFIVDWNKIVVKLPFARKKEMYLWCVWMKVTFN